MVIVRQPQVFTSASVDVVEQALDRVHICPIRSELNWILICFLDFQEVILCVKLVVRAVRSHALLAELVHLLLLELKEVVAIGLGAEYIDHRRDSQAIDVITLSHAPWT